MDIPNITAFLQNLSPIQILLVAFIILLLFGAKRLPELGRGLGRFLREFKRTTHEIEEDIRSSLDSDESDEKPRKKQKQETSRTPAAETPAGSVERAESNVDS